MKKLFSLFLFALIASAPALAQQGAASHTTTEATDAIHDRAGTGFAVNSPRIHANIKPNPVVDRSVVDAGGAVIRGIIIRNADGREIVSDPNVNAVRYMVERPRFSSGTHTVEIHTDFGSRIVKMAVQ